MDMSIDLISFLRNYYGISNSSLKSNCLTHNDVKILFPFVERTSFDYVRKNYDYGFKGIIIMVYDSRGNIIPYLNPFIENIEYDNDKVDNYFDNSVVFELDNLDTLSKEELLKIRKVLRKNRAFCLEKDVVRAIRKLKTLEPHEYRKRKELLFKEKDYD